MRPRSALWLLLVLVVTLVAAPELGAQGPTGPSSTPGGLRAYWHVFIAYAVGWVLVLGWIVSVARRLARLEERLALRED